MNNEKIVNKIKLAEEYAKESKLFPEATYQSILTFLLSSENLVEEKQDKTKSKPATVHNDKKAKKGLSQKIDDLIDEGFFDTAKTSKEIITKLKLMGYSMKVTSLPSYLIPKLHNQALIREEIKTKNGKLYGYIRKSK